MGGGGQGADNHCQRLSSHELSSCVGGSWGWVPEQSVATASLHFVLECFPKIQKVHTLFVFRLNLTQKAGCPVSQLTVVVAVSGQTQFAIIGRCLIISGSPVCGVGHVRWWSLVTCATCPHVLELSP